MSLAERLGKPRGLRAFTFFSLPRAFSCFSLFTYQMEMSEKGVRKIGSRDLLQKDPRSNTVPSSVGRSATDQESSWTTCPASSWEMGSYHTAPIDPLPEDYDFTKDKDAALPMPPPADRKIKRLNCCSRIGLMPKRRSRRILCISCLSFLFIVFVPLIILATYIGVTFSLPDYEVLQLRLGTGGENIKLNIGNGQPLSVTSNWVADVRFSNKNFFDLYLSAMDVVVSLKDVPDYPFATGFIGDTNVPGNRKNITVQIPLKINMSTAPDSRRAMSSMLDTCSKQPRVPVIFRVLLSGKVFGLGPITLPPKLLPKTVPCPKFLDFTRTIQNVFPFNLLRRNNTKKDANPPDKPK